MRDSIRLTNSQTPEEVQALTMRERLELAFKLLDALPKVPGPQDAEALTRLEGVLHHMDHADIPVWAWCVVKHYGNHDPVNGTWEPVIWTAHLTKEQAETFAQAGNEAEADWWRARPWVTNPKPDRFTVEHRVGTAIHQFIAPDADVRAYMRR